MSDRVDSRCVSGCGYYGPWMMGNKEIEKLEARVRELEEERRWRDVPGEMPKDDGLILIETREGAVYVIWYSTDDGWMKSNAVRWTPIRKALSPTQEVRDE